MNPTGSDPTPERQAIPEGPDIHSSSHEIQSPAGRVWAIAIATGLVAGLIAWAGGEAAHNAFRPRTFVVEVLGECSVQPTMGTQNAADYKNAVLAFSILGGSIGLMMGLAGGLASRSTRRGLAIGAIGLLSGAAVGAAASLAIIRLHYRGFVPNPNDLVTPIMIHGAIWTLVGAVGGAAFALGAGLRLRVANAVAGACIGAMLATLLVHVLGESFFPGSGYAEPIATSSPVRLLSRVLVAVLVSVGATRETIRSASHHKPTLPSEESLAV